jgi:hypothetical protein
VEEVDPNKSLIKVFAVTIPVLLIALLVNIWGLVPRVLFPELKSSSFAVSSARVDHARADHLRAINDLLSCKKWRADVPEEYIHPPAERDEHFRELHKKIRTILGGPDPGAPTVYQDHVRDASRCFVRGTCTRRWPAATLAESVVRPSGGGKSSGRRT